MTKLINISDKPSIAIILSSLSISIDPLETKYNASRMSPR